MTLLELYSYSMTTSRTACKMKSAVSNNRIVRIWCEDVIQVVFSKHPDIWRRHDSNYSRHEACYISCLEIRFGNVAYIWRKRPNVRRVFSAKYTSTRTNPAPIMSNLFIYRTMATVAGRVFVYGGKGALGSVCVSQFKSKNWWVGSIDMKANDQADANIIVKAEYSWKEQESYILSQVKDIIKEDKLDGIICVAGGWAGGNASNKDFLANTELMWKQSVWSSVIAASLAAQSLKEDGFLSLTGAKAALEGTSGMIGYGMAKAAVHQLTKSLAAKDSGLPAESLVASILPITLDTPMNRKWMPKADTTTWTPLEFIAELFWKWSQKQERPANGSLLQLVTKDNKTEVIPA